MPLFYSAASLYLAGITAIPIEPVQERLETQQKSVVTAQERLKQAHAQAAERLKELESVEQDYQARKRQERPTSQLALQRKRSQAAQRRCESRRKAYKTAQRKLTKTQARLQLLRTELIALRQCLERFRQENLTNKQPIEAEFRLDAGFGAYHNLALLVEMGYEVYTKPHSHKVTQILRSKAQETATWTRVGDNAEMIAWADLKLSGCPYPLDVALERFYIGKTLKHSALCHFGSDPVTQDLPAWFNHYNGRQIIEAGIKEKQTGFLSAPHQSAL